MNIHKNARLTFARRLEMVQDVLQRKLRPSAAAARHDVSVPTARKWIGRYLVQGTPRVGEPHAGPRGTPEQSASRAGLPAIADRRPRARSVRGPVPRCAPPTHRGRRDVQGALGETSVDPREVVKAALRHNAAALIFAHNHPSGLAEPSRADELLTQALKQALALVDCKGARPHRVGGASAVSFAEGRSL